MAIGDLKGPECVVIPVTSGVAIVIGDVVHIEASDGKWDPTAASDKGKFGVALDAATGADETVRVCIWGRVEVTATAAAIPKGYIVMADAAGAVTKTDWAGTTPTCENVGTAMTAFESGKTGTIWVGLGGN